MTYEALLDIADMEGIEVTETSLPCNLEGIYLNKHIRINKDLDTKTKSKSYKPAFGHTTNKLD